MVRGFAVVVAVAAVVAGAWLVIGRERVVHEERSAFQVLRVVEAGGRRCLRFGDGDRALNQSCRSLEQPERVELDYARGIVASTLSLQPRPRRVLVIGLGGASIVNALLAEWPDLHLDAVELDPRVIDLAEQHFAFRRTETVRGFGQDGALFVREAVKRGERYDVVILDACDDTGMPPALFTPDFLSQVRTLLGAEGAFLANTFPKAKSAPVELAAVRQVFGGVTEARVGPNRLLLAGRVAVPRQSTPALERIGADQPWLDAWQ